MPEEKDPPPILTEYAIVACIAVVVLMAVIEWVIKPLWQMISTSQ